MSAMPTLMTPVKARAVVTPPAPVAVRARAMTVRPRGSVRMHVRNVVGTIKPTIMKTECKVVIMDATELGQPGMTDVKMEEVKGPAASQGAWTGSEGANVTWGPSEEDMYIDYKYVDFAGIGACTLTGKMAKMDISGNTGICLDVNGLGNDKTWTIKAGGGTAEFKTPMSYNEAAMLWQAVRVPFDKLKGIDAKNVDKVEISSNGDGGFRLQVRGVGAY